MNYITVNYPTTASVQFEGYFYDYLSKVYLSSGDMFMNFPNVTYVDAFSNMPRISAACPAFSGYEYPSTYYNVDSKNILNVTIAGLTGIGNADVILFNRAGYKKMSDFGYLLSLNTSNFFVNNLILSGTKYQINNLSIPSLGYYSLYDNGGGTLVWSSTSLAIADQGAIIRPNNIASNQPGRWIRQFSGNQANVQMWGAVGDGVTNDQPAIQAAINYCSLSGINNLYFNSGNYYLSSWQTNTATESRSYLYKNYLLSVGYLPNNPGVNVNLNLYGAGNTSTTLFTNLSAPLISSSVASALLWGAESLSALTVNNLRLARNDAPVIINGNYINGNSTTEIFNCSPNSFYSDRSVLDYPNRVSYIKFDKVDFISGNRAITINRSYIPKTIGYISVTNCNFYYPNGGVSNTGGGGQIAFFDYDVASLYVNNCYAEGTTNTITVSSGVPKDGFLYYTGLSALVTNCTFSKFGVETIFDGPQNQAGGLYLQNPFTIPGVGQSITFTVAAGYNGYDGTQWEQTYNYQNFYKVGDTITGANAKGPGSNSGYLGQYTGLYTILALLTSSTPSVYWQISAVRAPETSYTNYLSGQSLSGMVVTGGYMKKVALTNDTFAQTFSSTSLITNCNFLPDPHTHFILSGTNFGNVECLGLSHKPGLASSAGTSLFIGNTAYAPGEAIIYRPSFSFPYQHAKSIASNNYFEMYNQIPASIAWYSFLNKDGTYTGKIPNIGNAPVMISNDALSGIKITNNTFKFWNGNTFNPSFSTLYDPDFRGKFFGIENASLNSVITNNIFNVNPGLSSSSILYMGISTAGLSGDTLPDYPARYPTYSNNTINSLNLNTIKELRNVSYNGGFNSNKFANINANVLGYYSANDGLGGTFVWSANSTDPDDGGITIKPNSISGAGRWIKQFTYSLSANVAMWGAVGDGVTNDQPAIQAAIDYCSLNNVPNLYFNAKTYFLSSFDIKPTDKVGGTKPLITNQYVYEPNYLSLGYNVNTKDTVVPILNLYGSGATLSAVNTNFYPQAYGQPVSGNRSAIFSILENISACTIDGFTFKNDGILCGDQSNSGISLRGNNGGSFGWGNASNYVIGRDTVTISNNTFINCHRAINSSSSTITGGSMNNLNILYNTFLYPKGSDSVSNAGGSQIMTATYDILNYNVIGNIAEGTTYVPANSPNLKPKDGFVFFGGINSRIVNNTLSRMGVESLYVGPNWSSALIPSAFTVPAVSGSVSVGPITLDLNTWTDIYAITSSYGISPNNYVSANSYDSSGDDAGIYQINTQTFNRTSSNAVSSYNMTMTRVSGIDSYPYNLFANSRTLAPGSVFTTGRNVRLSPYNRTATIGCSSIVIDNVFTLGLALSTPSIQYMAHNPCVRSDVGITYLSGNKFGGGVYPACCIDDPRSNWIIEKNDFYMYNNIPEEPTGSSVYTPLFATPSPLKTIVRNNKLHFWVDITGNTALTANVNLGTGYDPYNWYVGFGVNYAYFGWGSKVGTTISNPLTGQTYIDNTVYCSVPSLSGYIIPIAHAGNLTSLLTTSSAVNGIDPDSTIFNFVSGNNIVIGS